MRKIGEISALVVLLSVSRLAITIPNLEPIGAAALFGGALIASKYARFIIPMIALFIGDVLLSIFREGYSEHILSPTFIAVYASFAITVFVGAKLIGNQPKLKNVFGGAVLSSVLFFLITNFAVWLDPTFSMYPKTFAGLLTCYAMGIPFYKMTLLGNVVISVALFAGYSYYRKAIESKQVVA